MSRKLLIDATHPEEMRSAIVDDGKVKEFDYESINKKRITGDIYLSKVVRIEPSLQAVFVEYGGNRHGFLAFSEIHPDYYKIPVIDQQPDDGTNSGESEPEPEVQLADAEAAGAVEEQETAPGISSLEVVDSGGDNEPVELLYEPSSLSGEAAAEESADPASADSEAETSPDYEEESYEDLPGSRSDSSERQEIREEIRKNRKLQRKYKVQEVINKNQLLLIQVMKDERGSKGAALTTYISLAGRYCVLMPNSDRGGGISRKITNVADRRKLKKIAGELDICEGVGLIIRTAGANRTKQEIKRDYEYLIRQWDQIRQLVVKSTAPAKIFEEGGLIRRAIRDDYSKGIEEVIVDGESGYRTAKNFMKMMMPSHAKKVKKHAGKLPLFAENGIEEFLTELFKPVVQLPSGGYIVIGITEALVAIDVNSGRSTLHGSLEQTALETNLEAADVIAEQLRLRDLAGLIVIDFIDMEESKNNGAVERALRDNLKPDRSKIQIGKITSFGLLEMSRQRLRPGLIELASQPCAICSGTGMVRAKESIALQVLRQIEIKAASADQQRRIVATVPVPISNVILNTKRATLAHIEAAHSASVIVIGKPELAGNHFEIRQVEVEVLDSGETKENVISIETSYIDEESSGSDSDRRRSDQPRRRRRKSSRGQGRRTDKSPQATDSGQETGASEAQETAADQESEAKSAGGTDADQRKRGSRRGRRRSGGRGTRKAAPSSADERAAEERTAASQTAAADSGGSDDSEKPAKPARRRRRGGARRRSADSSATSSQEQPQPADSQETKAASPDSPMQAANDRGTSESGNGSDFPRDAKAEIQGATSAPPVVDSDGNDEPKPKRRTGWWSAGNQDR